jgi:hypothetical protein
MTNEEFFKRYREEINLASVIPVEMLDLFAGTFGLVRSPEESSEALLDRIADYIEQGKKKVEKWRSSKIGSTEKSEIK